MQFINTVGFKDRAYMYGLLPFPEKTRELKQLQHFLLSNIKTSSVGLEFLILRPLHDGPIPTN